MVIPTIGSVVLVPFPFSDLSQSKMRPAVVLAEAGRNDWILCQITSNPYGDQQAITISKENFRIGFFSMKYGFTCIISTKFSKVDAFGSFRSVDK